MSEHDLEKLLGGFAADTLTPKEKQALYAAALQDQQLFNALADEQTLKELLSDPDVRRRLLASLEQKSASGAGDSLSWLDWFRRPAGLAFAGGLSAAALAVVLGVRIYQDSLKQAAQSVATEEAKPAAPQAVAPQTKEKETLAPAIQLPKKDRASDVAGDSVKRQRLQDEARSQAETPLAAPSKSKDEMTSSADQKLAASATPPSPVPEPKQLQVPASGRFVAGITPAVSARALFYGEAPGRTEARSMAKEQEQAMKPLAESPSPANRLERPREGLAQLGKAGDLTAQLKPLGLRYSFVTRGTDGQEQEVDAAALKHSLSGVLTVETNQDAYLQVWETAGSSTPQLLWPKKETGQISLKMAAGQRERIPLPMGNEPVTLMALLSRIPLGPTMKREDVQYDRLSPKHLQESITASDRTGSQERAIYIVNLAPSTTAQIAVDIPLNR
ncbi:MAG TPA: hypothetical protein VLL94_09580 [Nitrospiraceae bacterium]|nr:hypothetical protein [Nitrospiraceae bacterium]